MMSIQRFRAKFPTLTCLVVSSLVWSTMDHPADAQGNKQRGVALGGLAGAVGGAIIGENSDKAGAGAAIGGVVGAVTGGLLGSAADKEQQAYARQQALYQQQQQLAAAQAAVSINDVVNMTRSGLSDHVIINQIRTRGVRHQLQVSEIIAMHQQGVSEAVITAMQQPTPPPAAPAPQVVQERYVSPPPVVVEEHYFVPHYPSRRVYYRSHYPRHRRRAGIHVRF